MELIIDFLLPKKIFIHLLSKYFKLELEYFNNLEH